MYILNAMPSPIKKTWKADQERLDSKIRPRWGMRPAAAIRRSDIEILHKEIGKRSSCGSQPLFGSAR